MVVYSDLAELSAGVPDTSYPGIARRSFRMLLCRNEPGAEWRRQCWMGPWRERFQ